MNYYLSLGFKLLEYTSLYALYGILFHFVYTSSQFHGILLLVAYLIYVASKYSYNVFSKEFLVEAYKQLEELSKKEGNNDNVRGTEKEGPTETSRSESGTGIGSSN